MKMIITRIAILFLYPNTQHLSFIAKLIVGENYRTIRFRSVFVSLYAIFNNFDLLHFKLLRELARKLVDPLRPGDFNQAVMELGATICSPTSPSCSKCPISLQCQALSLSMSQESIKVTDYPTKVPKAKQRHDFSAVSVVEIVEEGSDSKYLLVKRPEEGLLAGLWEFPSVLLEGEAGLTSRRKAIDSFLIKSFGLDMRKSCKVVLREEVGVYVHIFSHIRLKMYIELLTLRITGLFLPLLTPYQDI